METKGFKVTDIKVEYESNPLGLDVLKPRIAWKLTSSERGTKQTAYEIWVGSEKHASDMWISGKMLCDNSIGIIYEGKPFKPCTRYYVSVTVWNQNGEAVTNDEAFFETGFLNPSLDAWDGANWIGAPEYYVSADTIGVFSIESRITLEAGSKRAGIVFGANDSRLLDSTKNEYLIAGENFIRYELDVEHIPAKLHIYRVGYHKDDRKDIPFASIPVVDWESDEKTPVITEANKYASHLLKVVVEGNCAYAYVDDILVDAVNKTTFFGEIRAPRQLNPRGDNDTTTFPRLNEIGYYVGNDDKVHFDGLTVKYLRSPGNTFITMDTENGLTLDGKDKEGNPAEVQLVRDPSKHSIPMLRRNFYAAYDKKIEKARLYATARGIYECRINGRDISNQWFAPGASQFDKHIMYQTYDVTEHIREGENGIGFTLASGWWSDAQTFVVKNYNYYGDKVSLLAKLVITYEDGSTDVYVTNEEDWQYYGEGPYTYAGFFQGEHYDARKADIYRDYSKADFRSPLLKKPAVITPDKIEETYTMPKSFGRSWPAVNEAEPEIIGGVNAPVYEVARLTAKAMTEPRKGVYIYDLGQEIAGVPVVKFKEKAGTVIILRYGEILYPALPEYGDLKGMMLIENLRDASSTDIYTARGEEEGDIYTPKFTFHGYRYIEISGISKPLPLEAVQSIQLSSVQRITGQLECSNPLINRFIENVKWSQLCNFISIPTDCPQRNERMGWAGDTHVFCRTATYQSDTRLFYYRYLQALRDLQVDGQFPNIAPIGGGFGGITYEIAMLIMVWELYQQYGDKETIKEYYASMKDWMDFMKKQGMPGIVNVGPLGDWLAPEETDNHLIWNAFYGYAAELMSKMAGVIGREEDSVYYSEINIEVKNYWNDTFIEKETKKTCSSEGKIIDTQCSYALPIAFNILSDQNTSAAYTHLARKTKEVGYKVYTGFFGTSVLNTALTKAGYPELAYKLINQTAYPSWLYPVTQGATTIWERWDSFTHEKGFGGNNSMNSFNHYSLGAVLSWMYESVLGILRDENCPGYRHFTLKPSIMEFQYAKGGFDSPYGRIESSWEVKDGETLYTCLIPANSAGTLILETPDKGMEKRFELESGLYRFKIAAEGIYQAEA